MMVMKAFCISLLLIFVFAMAAAGQTCSPPAIVANANSANIFSPEQEMILGELTLQSKSGEIRLIRNEVLQAYVDAIGERLIKHLPPSGLKFHFHIIDIPEANAFNIPGGHVFLSRKLIAFAKNEDELAAVMAHELGHATVHHSATDISVMFKKILNVTSLGDRKDINEKYNLLIENARTKQITRKGGHEDDQQLEADRIGLFALVAAGYDSTAFFTLFDRLTESKGKTGNWFSDMFGKTTPNQKRLREMAQMTDKLPAACREGRTASRSDDFLKWQADTVSFRGMATDEALPGLIWKKELSQKLRSDISHIQVSRDGRWIVTRDDFSLTVVRRDPLEVHFQIPVEDVDDVYITPDSRFVVFTTAGLRFEKWSIDEKKPVEVREMVLRRECLQSKLSPDGNYLACIDTSVSVNLINTRTGERIFQKKDFYRLNYSEYVMWALSDILNKDDGGDLFRIGFSPDSRFVIFSRSIYFRSGPSTFNIDALESSDTTLVLDLATLQPVNTGGETAHVFSRAYAFLDEHRVLGMTNYKVAESGVFSFPEGKRLQQFSFYATDIKATGNPNYFIVKPLQHTSMGIFEAGSSQLVAGLNKADATIWNDQFIYESISGKLVVHRMIGTGRMMKIDDSEVASVDIPVAAIGNLSAAQVSNNFNWVALSSKTRGGVWNVQTGERKIYTRGFRGGIMADDGGTVGEFARLDEDNHALALLNPSKAEVGNIRDLSEKGSKQYGRFVLTRSSLVVKDPKEKGGKALPVKSDDDKNKDKPSVPIFYDTDFSLRENVHFELKDFIKDKVIWTRDFPKDVPGYSFDSYSGRLIFYWRLGSETGKVRLKESAELKARAEALGNKDDDYLIEVVDAFAGKTLGDLFVETGKGSFDLFAGLSEGDWLVFYDSEDRVLVYSLKTGELRHRFFGGRAALNPVRNQIAVENFPGEVSVFDLNTGDAMASFTIKGSAAFVRFNLEGNKVFVLSDQQAAYAFDLNKITASPRIP